MLAQEHLGGADAVGSDPEGAEIDCSVQELGGSIQTECWSQEPHNSRPIEPTDIHLEEVEINSD